MSSQEEPEPPGTVVAEAADGAEEIQRVKRALGINDNVTAALLLTRAQMAEVVSMQGRVLDKLDGMGGGQRASDRSPGVSGAYPVDASRTIAAGSANNPTTNEEVRVPDEENFTRITAVTLGWPSGTDNGAGIKCRTGDGLDLVPRNPEDDYIAFDDFVETFTLDYVLHPGEELVTETINYDGNGHFLNTVYHIEEMDISDEDELEV